MARKREFIGAVDQGTTSSRFLIFDNDGKLITFHQLELPQTQPQPGWIEHDPLDILDTVVKCIDQTIHRFELMGYDVKDIKGKLPILYIYLYTDIAQTRHWRHQPERNCSSME